MLTKELIVLDCKATTKLEVIESLAQLAFKQGKVNNPEKFVKAVLAREAEYSTGVGFNIAIPHGKDNSILEPVLLYAKVNNVDWQSMDDQPVKAVFMIGVPGESEGQVHLQILAKLSRSLMKEEFRQSLFDASSIEDVLTLFSSLSI
ncbi:MAG: fructose PTS transporter subunit IIA [Erysipelotrichaceae bacterium]|nr:fructose PTS transporter subunit IIA [Erysipelotrichaceae bacterium]